jgi:xylanolytic transcriptional activator XlnR
VRERKKRGKASRKDIAQQQAAAAAAAAAANGGTAPPSGDSTSGSPQSRSNGFNEDTKTTESTQSGQEPLEQRPLPDLPPPSLPPPGRSASMATTRGMDGAAMYQNVTPMARTMSLGAIDAIPENGVHPMAVSNDGMGPMQPPRLQTTNLPMHNPIQEYNSMDEFHRNLMHHSPHPMMQNGMHPIIPSNGMPEYSDSPYSMMSPQSAQAPPNAFRMPAAESPMPGFMGHSPVSGSPGWLSLPSPSTTMYPGTQHANAPQQLRYVTSWDGYSVSVN